MKKIADKDKYLQKCREYFDVNTHNGVRAILWCYKQDTKMLNWKPIKGHRWVFNTLKKLHETSATTSL